MTETPQEKPSMLQQGQSHQTGLMALAEKFSFFLPPKAAIKLPGLMLTMSFAAIAVYTGAQLTHVTPLIVAISSITVFGTICMLAYPVIRNSGILQLAIIPVPATGGH